MTEKYEDRMGRTDWDDTCYYCGGRFTGLDLLYVTEDDIYMCRECDEYNQQRGMLSSGNSQTTMDIDKIRELFDEHHRTNRQLANMMINSLVVLHPLDRTHPVGSGEQMEQVRWPRRY